VARTASRQLPAAALRHAAHAAIASLDFALTLKRARTRCAERCDASAGGNADVGTTVLQRQAYREAGHPVLCTAQHRRSAAQHLTYAAPPSPLRSSFRPVPTFLPPFAGMPYVQCCGRTQRNMRCGYHGVTNAPGYIFCHYHVDQGARRMRLFPIDCNECGVVYYFTNPNAGFLCQQHKHVSRLKNSQGRLFACLRDGDGQVRRGAGASAARTCACLVPPAQQPSAQGAYPISTRRWPAVGGRIQSRHPRGVSEPGLRVRHPVRAAALLAEAAAVRHKRAWLPDTFQDGPTL
jgi:hypothetical protein